MALTFSLSEIVALSLESILYGVYLLLFIQCMDILYQKRRSSGAQNIRLVAISVGLFITITWHEVVDIFRLVSAYKSSESPEGADLYYANVTSALSIIKTSLYLVMTIMSDMFMLYRCYVVWGELWIVVVLPSLLFLADIGTGIASVHTLSSTSTDPAFSVEQERITNSFFSCTLALNAICTGLIAFRIWWSQHKVKDAQVKSSSIMRVAVIVVESGAAYVITLILLVATYAAQSITFNIFLDMMSPVIGVVFALIIVRVSKGITSDQTTFQTQTRSMAFAIPVRPHRGGSVPHGPGYSFGSTADDSNNDSQLQDTFNLKRLGPGESQQKLPV